MNAFLPESTRFFPHVSTVAEGACLSFCSSSGSTIHSQMQTFRLTKYLQCIYVILSEL